MNPTWRWARVGVCPMSASGRVANGLIPPNARLCDAFACYRLLHAGFFVDWLLPTELSARLPYLSVLVTIGEGTFEDEQRLALHQFLEGGGIWIAIGSPCDAPDLLGVALPAQGASPYRQLSEGYAVAERDCPAFQQEWGMLHCFGGTVVVPDKATEVWAYWLDAHGRDTGLPAITHRRVGAGHAVLYAVHLGETFLRIQLGRAVSEPLIPPADAPPEASLALRTEDATRLDWYLDRTQVEAGQLCFAKPVADLWAESLIRTVLWAGQQRGEVVPMQWYYPAFATALGVMSVTSEPEATDYETSLNHLLTLAGVRAVWCISDAARQPHFYRELLKREHELALRFQPDAEQFCRTSTLQGQVDSLRRFTGVRAIHSVQVAGLAWRGGTEFYAHAEHAQLLCELSRGGYHPHASGFLFGTAHPFRVPNPQRPAEPYQPFIVPLHAYRALEWVSSGLITALLERATERHGVYHITVCPSVLSSPVQADGLMRLIGRARYLGAEWYTAREVAHWLNARLNLRYKLQGTSGQLELGLLSVTPMHRLGLLLFTPLRGWANVGDQQTDLQPAEYYGYPCLTLETDLVEKTVREIRFFEVASNAA